MGNANLLLVSETLLTARFYHKTLTTALHKKYPLHLIQKHFKPVLNIWIFFGLFISFCQLCALLLNIQLSK